MTQVLRAGVSKIVRSHALPRCSEWSAALLSKNLEQDALRCPELPNSMVDTVAGLVAWGVFVWGVATKWWNGPFRISLSLPPQRKTNRRRRINKQQMGKQHSHVVVCCGWWGRSKRKPIGFLRQVQAPVTNPVTALGSACFLRVCQQNGHCSRQTRNLAER